MGSHPSHARAEKPCKSGEQNTGATAQALRQYFFSGGVESKHILWLDRKQQRIGCGLYRYRK